MLKKSEDLKYLDQGYVASAHDVGVFLRALNDGSLLIKEEREIYSSIFQFNHTGWVLGYSSIARYHEDIDTVLFDLPILPVTTESCSPALCMSVL